MAEWWFALTAFVVSIRIRIRIRLRIRPVGPRPLLAKRFLAPSAVVFTFDGREPALLPLWENGSMCFGLVSVSLLPMAPFLAPFLAAT